MSTYFLSGKPPFRCFHFSVKHYSPSRFLHLDYVHWILGSNFHIQRQRILFFSFNLLTELFSQPIIDIDVYEEQRYHGRYDRQTLWIHLKAKNPEPPSKSSPTNILSARNHVWNGAFSSDGAKRIGEPYCFGNSEEAGDKGKALLPDQYNFAMARAIERDLWAV